MYRAGDTGGDLGGSEINSPLDSNQDSIESDDSSQSLLDSFTTISEGKGSDQSNQGFQKIVTPVIVISKNENRARSSQSGSTAVS